MLLKEEMRRVIVYLEYKAKWWEARADAWDALDDETAEGIRAYALRQASIQRALSVRFVKLWAAPLAANIEDNSPADDLADDGLVSDVEIAAGDEDAAEDDGD